MADTALDKPKFSKPMTGDADALYMSVPEVAGLHIAERSKDFSSCVELCCAVGAMAVHVAKYVPEVTAVDMDPARIEAAKINAETYGVSDRIEFIQGDVLDESLLKSISADVAILDPDWSAAGEQKSIHAIDIDSMQPSMRQMILLTQKHITPNLVLRVPKHFDLTTLQEFGAYELESVYINGELKFKVVYFLPGSALGNETSIEL